MELSPRVVVMTRFGNFENPACWKSLPIFEMRAKTRAKMARIENRSKTGPSTASVLFFSSIIKLLFERCDLLTRFR